MLFQVDLNIRPRDPVSAAPEPILIVRYNPPAIRGIFATSLGISWLKAVVVGVHGNRRTPVTPSGNEMLRLFCLDIGRTGSRILTSLAFRLLNRSIRFPTFRGRASRSSSGTLHALFGDEFTLSQKLISFAYCFVDPDCPRSCFHLIAIR